MSPNLCLCWGTCPISLLSDYDVTVCWLISLLSRDPWGQRLSLCTLHVIAPMGTSCRFGGPWQVSHLWAFCLLTDPAFNIKGASQRHKGVPFWTLSAPLIQLLSLTEAAWALVSEGQIAVTALPLVDHKLWASCLIFLSHHCLFI